MHKRFFLFLFLLSGSISAQDTLTIEKAIQLLMENNFSIKIADRSTEVAANNYTLGNAGFLPTLGVNASKTYNINDSRVVRFPDVNGVVQVQNVNGARGDNQQANATLNWTIFNGMAMFNAYSRFGELKQAARDSLQIVMENSVATLSNNYYNVIQQVQRLNVLNSALRISAQRLELARAQYEVGSGSKLNYLAAQVDYNTDSSTVILQVQQLQNAKVGLNQVLSRAGNTPFSVADTIIVDETLDLANLKEATRRNNPSLILAQHRSNAAYFSTKILQGQRWPTINVFTGYGYSQNTAQTGFASENRNLGFNYGISATMNIFNGFNQNRLIQNAKIQKEIADLRINDLQLQLDANLEVAYNNYRNSLNLLSIEQQNLNVAQQNVEIAVERYRIGVATFLELRDVQLNVVRTAGRLIDAEFNTKLAEIELLRLSSEIIRDQPAR
jgi:outer membrane protein TolC